MLIDNFENLNSILNDVVPEEKSEMVALSEFLVSDIKQMQLPESMQIQTDQTQSTINESLFIDLVEENHSERNTVPDIINFESVGELNLESQVVEFIKDETSLHTSLIETDLKPVFDISMNNVDQNNALLETEIASISLGAPTLFKSEVPLVEPIQNIPFTETELNKFDVPQETVTENLKVVADIKATNEQKKNDKLVKPKVSVSDVKKDVRNAAFSKAKTITSNSKLILASTLPKPTANQSVVSKTTAKSISSTTNRTIPAKLTTKPISTISKTLTSTLRPKTTLAISKVNGSATSRAPTSVKPLVSATVSKTTIKPTNAVAPKVSSTVKSSLVKPTPRPLTSRSSASQLKPIEPKPMLKKSVPSPTKLPTTRTAHPIQSTSSLPRTAQLKTSSTLPGNRTQRITGATSALSKTSSIRPASKAISTVSNKPVTKAGVSNTVNGTKTIRTKQMVAKGAESLEHSNRKNENKSFSSKRSIGVENSLKQELEDAVMNGINGGSHSSTNPQEIVNNSH